MRKIRNTGEPMDVSGGIDDLDERLRTESGLVALFLYGSYGTELQAPLSDVDIAVLFADGTVPGPDEHLRLVGVVTDALRGRLTRKPEGADSEIVIEMGELFRPM